MIKDNEIKIVTMSSSEKADELAGKMSELIGDYAKFLSEFEIIGILDILKLECYETMMNGVEE